MSSPGDASAGISSALLAWGRLFRISLFPTAVADVLAGLLLAGAGTLPAGRTVLLLAAASLCVYHAGLALNDWCDREADRTTRPGRPLASGRIAPAAALRAALALFGLGVALAALAAPRAGLWMAAIAALVVLYDTRGRGPWSGPSLLGACRGANLSLGIAYVGPADAARWAWVAPLLYGAYVFVVSRLGRLEDEEDRDASGRRPRRHLLAAAFALLAVALLPVASATLASRAGALAIAGAAAFGLFARALSVREWSTAAIGASMGLALRRLLAFTAALALLTGTGAGLAASVLILLGFPLSYFLRERFPPS